MHLTQNPSLKDFCNKIKKFQLNTKAKVCGLDLKENYESFKLYIELTSIPSKQILSNFLSSNLSDLFLNFCQHWDSSKSSGLALGFKVNTLKEERSYFHIKFNSNYKPLLYQKQLSFLSLLKIDISNLDKAISYEILNDSSFYDKFYVYVRNQNDISKILSLKFKDLKLNLEEIEELEIYASANTYKINIVNKMENFLVKQDVWKTIPNQYISRVSEYSNFLDTPPIYTGLTKSEIYSVYFSLTNKPKNILEI